MRTMKWGAMLTGAVLLATLIGCAVQPAYGPGPGVLADGSATTQPPPPIPEYDQPPCPNASYLWTPGYWAFAPAGYYWVPGTWVAPPQVGVLWTPGYWAYADAVYVFHSGYWGPHVGYYGGINYGGGYTGSGYAGARWVGNSIRYNTAVTNVNTTIIHNTYNETVINNVTVSRVSYVGGPAGGSAQPTQQELAATRDQHLAATPGQVQHVRAAATTPQLLATHNQGQPPIAATPRPGAFTAEGVTAAKPTIRAAQAAATPRAAHREPAETAAENDKKSEKTPEAEPRP
jgi:hypothetical protein